MKKARRKRTIDNTVRTKRWEIRMQLDALTKCLDKAAQIAGRTPWAYKFKDDLERLRETSDKLAAGMVIRPTGNAQTTAALKRECCLHAFDMMLYSGHDLPTLTKPGDYFDLASYLYEMTTGEIDVEMVHPCTAVFRQLEEEGFPDSTKRMAMRLDRRTRQASYVGPPTALEALMMEDSPRAWPGLSADIVRALQDRRAGSAGRVKQR